ncbi:MAG: putative SpoU-like rRNA methylase [Chlamydiia bacterium]|nr:putative SpoU-like rRNA methylase [Chlamydiia bacterium]
MNQDDKYSPYSSLRDLGPYFIGEGEEVVKALFRSNLKVLSILMEERYIPKLTIPADIKIEIATQEELQKITGYKMHQGIMAIGVKPLNTPLHEMHGAALVLNGIVDPENVGAIVRNAVAFGIRNLIVDTYSSPPYLRRTIKVSRGALFQMKIHITSDLPLLLKDKQGVAASLSNQSTPLERAILPKDPYFIFGRESTGIDQKVLDTALLQVKIPIDPIVDSLNVAVACGIVLYHYNCSKELLK